MSGEDQDHIGQAKRDIKTALAMLERNPDRIPAVIEMLKLAIAELKGAQ
jgi:hypothetical protein